MKRLPLGLLLCVGLVAVAAVPQGPPGYKPALAGTRHEIAGYSVQVPGKGWLESKTPQGVIFGKRTDATESYHAGLGVTPAPNITDKADLAALAEKLVNDQPSNPRYTMVRNEHTVTETGALWVLRGRMDFQDAGAVNVGKRGALATHNAYLLAFNPRDRGQLIKVWFSWRGAEFDDAKFAAEAERFFASFKVAGTAAAATK